MPVNIILQNGYRLFVTSFMVKYFAIYILEVRAHLSKCCRGTWSPHIVRPCKASNVKLINKPRVSN